MILAQPDMIRKIDAYARDRLGIPTEELMLRAGGAVARTVRDNIQIGKRVTVFAGKGNNGGDGYAAAYLLHSDYDVTVFDVFGAGQSTDEGRLYLDSYLGVGGTVRALSFDGDTAKFIRSSDCIIDAVFGTGFKGNYPESAVKLAEIFASSDSAFKVAVDVPLGVNASDGSVDVSAVYGADTTVSLGFIKPGLISYPAKKYVGKLVYDNIGLQNKTVMTDFEFKDFSIDHDLARSLIPKREDNSNKGSFGKLLLVTGSPAFPGAARLSLEAALRSGVGLCTYLGEEALCTSISATFPEAIYKPCSVPSLTPSDLDYVTDLAKGHTAILIGSGSSRSDGLYRLIERLLSSDGAPLILDADAINTLAEHPEGRELIRASRRKVILTPHPLELSRISGIPTDVIQSSRICVAKQFAKENKCILILKGAATVVTDGESTYINTSGSSTLAKAGSGDVLAGTVASVTASGVDPLSAAVFSVYFHGLAADVLAEELSELGVTPSDLPREIARQIKSAQ